MKRLIPIVALWALMCAVSAYAQTGVLLPNIPPAFTNQNGTVASSARLCSFAAGTNTPRAMYANSALSTTLPNPNTLNAIGMPVTSGGQSSAIYLDPSLDYKFILYQAGATGSACPLTGTAIWTRDQVNPANVTGSGTTGYIPKFNGARSLTNSLMYDNGTEIDLTGGLLIDGNLSMPVAPTSKGSMYFDSTLGTFQCSQSNHVYSPCSLLEPEYSAGVVNGGIFNSPSSSGSIDISILNSGTRRNAGRMSASSTATTAGITICPSNQASFASCGPSIALVHNYSTGVGTLTIQDVGSGLATTILATTQFTVYDTNGTAMFDQTLNNLTLDSASATNTINLKSAGVARGTIIATNVGIKTTQTGGAAWEVQTSAAVFKDSAGNNSGLWNTTSSATATNFWLLQNGTLVNVMIESSSTSCQSGTKKCLYLN